MSMTSYLLAAACIAVLVTMGLGLTPCRTWTNGLRPTLAANMFGTKTVLFIGILGFFTERPEFLDIALVYALMNFISVIAILKYADFRGAHKPSEVTNE